MARCHNNLRKSGALRMFLRCSVKFCTILWVFSQKQKYIILNPFLAFELGINHYDVSLSFFLLHCIPFKSYWEGEGVSGLTQHVRLITEMMK